ncbi:MAG: histidinol dehydrogenase [Solirubrobacteraceae bacterium]
MRCERLTLTAAPAAAAAGLRALVPAPDTVQETVAEIIAAVRTRGDQALVEYTRRFDTDGTAPPPLLVSDGELDAAAQGLEGSVRAALQRAIENVRTVAAAGSGDGRATAVDLGSHRVLLRKAPVTAAAVYVPAGRAPYPSTVVMGVVPARVAGVGEVAVCAPPGRDGAVDPVLLGACRLAGASRVYRMGGAQAIAALAYGTESVASVDVIVGPGNLYVQEAKRQVFGQVGIEGFAGPSDLVVIADADSDAEPLALDLLAQAEHGPGTLVVGISESAKLIERLGARIDEAKDTGAVACLVEVADTDQALALAQAFAPEHLQLVGSRAEALAPRLTRAGCLFVGPASGTAFGDYIAGPSHILPTAGAARFVSALSPEHFLRAFAEVRIGDADELARVAAPLARAEGFKLHARSMEVRIRDNGRR